MKKSLLVLACLVRTCTAFADDGLRALRDHVVAHPAGDGPFTLDRTAWSGGTQSLPIGMFDSGIGGLTVLEAVLKLDAFHNDTLQPGPDGRPDFERERFIYFGDQANMPYGNYAAAGQVAYLRELIVKDAVFLLGKRFHPEAGQPAAFTKPPVKALVIACNTATAYGLQDVRDAVAAWGIPVFVVGVVEAGARGVLESQPETKGAVAVLATLGTCASGAYPKAIESALGRAGRPLPGIVQQGSAELAGVIEGNPAFSASVAETALRDVRALLETHRQSGSALPIETVVLGCTHFPLVQREIEAAFVALHAEPAYAALTAAPRTYIDPAECTARELFRELARSRLRLPAGQSSVLPADRFFLSVPNPACPEVKLSRDGALDHDYKYGRRTGQLDREDTVNVPLTAASLPESSARLVQEKLPLVWERLQSRP